jgi:hypothetical protein
MRMSLAIVLTSAALSTSWLMTSNGPAAAQSRERLAQTKGFCVQVISCGTKDGKVKEYPTPCDAKDDGATNIHPKNGSSC